VIQGVGGQLEIAEIGLALRFHSARYDGQDANIEGTEFETKSLSDDFDGALGGRVASYNIQLVY
jgi:hypothetical protein